MTQTIPSSHPGRDIRQRDLVPPAKLAACHPVVVGVGAIGRQVAIQLAAVGAPVLTLVDHDIVGEENLAPQAYWPADIGRMKVSATATVCRQINPDILIHETPRRFARSMARMLLAGHQGQSPARPAVFCCVDSISARQMIWEALKPYATLLVDGRMNAEVIRVLASDRPAADDYYATTLFDEERAYAGSCTAKSTVYTASIAAGLMLGQFTRWLRGIAVDRDVTVNLLAGEMTAA